ncbi:hypothetical protein NM688_g8630 [Phlebia brevispora]|uniref:Uncharacterized protein n=1 Tax=Phlebia brevispora TaxID=194682 RepID=A0ACC1RRK2_9APHY|nr:hypothetical protein NM688_g8630 [Phlebia brevispora]
MVLRTSALFQLSFTVFSLVPFGRAYVNYANDFVNPTYVLSKNFDNTTIPAQETILAWADQADIGSPWSVTNKSYLAPSGDPHDYMSWAPYAWPNCSNVDNTTALTQQQIWTECIYVTRDDFDSLANAVLFNSLAFALNGSESYAARVANYINVWFLDSNTYMNPNLNYAQMQRGIYGQNGSHTGVLDLKCMAKIASGILVLRQGKAQSWTSDIDTQFQDWINKYIVWLTTNTLALQEKAATNNHGSFYFNQLAALQILVANTTGASSTIQEYFNGIYMNQIAANGDQVGPSCVLNFQLLISLSIASGICADKTVPLPLVQPLRRDHERPPRRIRRLHRVEQDDQGGYDDPERV